MATPLIIRLGATTEFGLIVAGNTGWFPHYLPLAGSAAAEAFLVMGTAIVLHELCEIAREIALKLRAWRQHTKVSPTSHSDVGERTNGVNAGPSHGMTR